MGGEQSGVSSPICLIPELDGHLLKNVDKYTHSVQIGVTLTATRVHLDTAVLSASRATHLQYINTIFQLMLPFTAMDLQYKFNIGSQFYIAFPKWNAPGDQSKACRDNYTLALSCAAIDDQQIGDACRVKAEISIPLHCLVLPPFGLESRGDAANPSPWKLHDPGG